MSLRHVRLQQLLEHAIAEVRLDKDVLDLLSLREIRDGMECMSLIPSLHSLQRSEEQLAHECFDDCNGSLVLTAAGGIDHDDGTRVLVACIRDVHGAVQAVACKAHIGNVTDGRPGIAGPHNTHRRVILSAVEVDQVALLQRVSLCVRQRRIEHELKSKTGATVTSLTFSEVEVGEALRIGGGTHSRSCRDISEDVFAQRTVVVGQLPRVGEAGWPDAAIVAALTDAVVDRLLGLWRTKVNDLSPWNDQGLKFLNQFRESLAHALRESILRNFDVVRDEKRRAPASQLASYADRAYAWCRRRIGRPHVEG